MDSGFSVQIRVDWISQTWSCGLTAVSRLGWRPVLELARKPDFQKLEVGQKLLCWGWQSLVNGILLENGTYDLVLQRQDAPISAPRIQQHSQARPWTTGHCEQVGRGWAQEKGEIEWEQVQIFLITLKGISEHMDLP